jgi:hypothetical protein
MLPYSTLGRVRTPGPILDDNGVNLSGWQRIHRFKAIEAGTWKQIETGLGSEEKRSKTFCSAFFRAFSIAPGAIDIEGGAIFFSRANRCHSVLSDGTITHFAEGDNFSGASPLSVAEN